MQNTINNILSFMFFYAPKPRCFSKVKFFENSFFEAYNTKRICKNKSQNHLFYLSYKPPTRYEPRKPLFRKLFCASRGFCVRFLRCRIVISPFATRSNPKPAFPESRRHSFVLCTRSAASLWRASGVYTKQN